jgi:hypothetical protein
MTNHVDLLNDIISRIGGVEPSVGFALNPLADVVVKDLELLVGGKLPELHVSFLRAFGSVIFTEPTFYQPEKAFPRHYSRTNRGIVCLMLGAVHPEFPKAKSIAISYVFSQLEGEIGEGLMPFADNGAGDYLCLRARGEPHGAVYLWNHEGPPGNDLYYVSPSFESWLQSLYIS